MAVHVASRRRGAAWSAKTHPGAGPAGGRLLSYGDARRSIYLPTYRWVLEHRAAGEVAALRELAARGDVVLLDYTTNGDVADLRTPLSHAALIAAHLEDRRP